MAVATRSRAQSLFEGTAPVKGQEKARRQMAVLLDRQWAVAEGHLKHSSGALIGGRSGSGKTMLARAMCRLSGLPFAEVNATRYTEAGYAGLDLQQMFLPLLESAARMYDASRERAPMHVQHQASTLFQRPPAELAEITALAETGVVLLDEFDKWMLRINHVTGQRDTTIQADLLKMVEGTIEYVSNDNAQMGIPFDTTRVLILCAGAFVNLQEAVAQRLQLAKDDENLWDQILQEDFVRFGLLPELAGRLATHIFLRPLKIEHLAGLLEAEGGLLDEYRLRFEAAGCRWAVSDAGVRELSAQAIKRATGARAVEHILWTIFSPALYKAAIAGRSTRVTYEPMWAEARVE